MNDLNDLNVDISTDNMLKDDWCIRCGNKLKSGALFCGSCGAQQLPDFQNTSVNTKNNNLSGESMWGWISPVISLWVLLLSTSCVLGIIIHFTENTSPALTLITHIIDIAIIVIFCVYGFKLFSHLLSNFRFNIIVLSAIVIGSLIFIYAFMWAYFFLLGMMGIESLLYLSDYYNYQWPIWSAFILISVIPGIFEELAFRGYIMSRLEQVGTPTEALIIQAVLFSTIHLSPAMFISHFVLGIVLGLIRTKTQSLYPGIFVHMSWNAIVLLEELLLT